MAILSVTARRPQRVALAALLSTLLSPSLARAEVRVKDLVEIEGVRKNALTGYGLVVGLAGTGDREGAHFTQQSIASMLGRLGVRVDPNDVRVRNVAAVMVTTELPAFARPGSRLDVTVSALGDARSLVGGTLLMTPLLGPDGKTYALAQGSVEVGGFDARALGVSQQRNQPSSGRVPSGGVVERSVSVDLRGKPVVLQLKNPDFTTAMRVADAVNALLGDGVAVAQDAAAVRVQAESSLHDDPVRLISSLEALTVEVDRRAKIVISERTGTIVAGSDVRIRPVVVMHGGFRVSVESSPVISQPNALSFGGETVRDRQTAVNAGDEPGRPVVLGATTTVEDLAASLEALGASTRDLISILQAMKLAGALDADLEVM
jgi:flagellar P-ring protein precursor FlgI